MNVPNWAPCVQWDRHFLGAKEAAANVGHMGVLRGVAIGLETDRGCWWGSLDLGQRLLFAFRRTLALPLPRIHFLNNRPPGFSV